MSMKSTLFARTPVLIVCLAIALAGLLAACGADPDPTPTRTAPRAAVTPAPTATAVPTAAAPAPTATARAEAAPTATPTPVPPTATPTPRPTPTPQSGPNLPVTVTDVHGNEVTVKDISRIVSLNGDITEVIFALGLGDNVVAVDTSATYPPEAHQLPKIGYQRRLSAEGLLSMAPTLVIGNENAGPPETIEQVGFTGTPVVILESVSTIDGAARKIRGVAQALGVPQEGEEIATELESEIDHVKTLADQAQDQPTAVMLYMRGLDSLFLIGQYHLSHELFEASGAMSGGAAAGVTAPYIPLTAESLAAANPDCIVVLTAGLQSVGGREGLRQIPGVGQTAAAQQDCILDFDDQYFGGGGPRMGQVLMDLLRAFHPDLATAG